jgi:hypothetical protein
MLKLVLGRSSTANVDGDASESPVTSSPGESKSPAAKSSSRQAGGGL